MTLTEPALQSPIMYSFASGAADTELRVADIVLQALRQVDVDAALRILRYVENRLETRGA